MMFIREKRLPPTGPAGRVNRTVQLPPDMEQALPFFTSRAPERLPAPEPWPAPASRRFSSRGARLSLPDMPGRPRCRTCGWCDLDGDKQLDCSATDMRQGLVFTGSPARARCGADDIASIPHPAHVTLADVDKDGIQDLLVGDLGEFFPADHNKGAVDLAARTRPTASSAPSGSTDGRASPTSKPPTSTATAGTISRSRRLAGGRPGEIAVLENTTTGPTQPSFTTHTDRPARRAASTSSRSISITTARWTSSRCSRRSTRRSSPTSTRGRGLHVRAEGHLRGAASELGIVGHPARRSRQGRRSRRPPHARRHVRRRDREAVSRHPVAREHRHLSVRRAHASPRCRACHRAEAADLDGDGDLDIVACALLAGGSDVDETTLPALVWLEQTTPGTYVRHTIEMGMPRHATLDVGDIDGDGDIDIVVGNFSVDKPAPPPIEVWTNQRKKPSAP